MSAPAEPGAEPGLKCLSGRSCPPGMAADLGRMSSLPKSARERFWQALAPALRDPLPKEIESSLDDFCRRHGTTRVAVAPVLAASRFLVRAASLIDLPVEDLAADIAALTGGDGEIVSVLTGGYDAVKELVRREVKHETLADHGNLLERVDWRMDVVASSNRGGRLAMPIALLTFRYREGDERKRVTLQLEPSTVLELKAICEQILT
ncbi:MAG: COMM domain-containing protein [Polyangiaceae bacterium]